MTCVECGAEMGTASACARCGAPVPPHLLDKPGDLASQQDAVASPPSPNPEPAGSFGCWSGCLLVTVVSAAAIVLVAAVGTYVTQGSPAHAAQTGQEYLNLRGCLTWAIPSASVLALTAVGGVVSHMSTVRKRRAIASDSPQPLQENSD